MLWMRAHPHVAVRAYADLMLGELRKVIPAFLKRADLPDRGGAWSAYLAETRRAAEDAARRMLGGETPMAGMGGLVATLEEGTLTRFLPDGEDKGDAAALSAASALPLH